jgi:hypothetical protein
LKFRELIRYGGYNPLLRYNTEEDGDEDVGIRILSICYSPNYAEACFAICIDQDGSFIFSLFLTTFINYLSIF